ELRGPDGAYNGIRVNRLKEKLGTRMLPTAELTLDGALATPIGELKNGVRRITPMLNITRLWNSVCAVAKMRRGIALARDYATRRVAFGAKLADKPLHLDTLAGLQAEFEGAFHLAFRCAELLGREETGEATDKELAMTRLLTPLMKLTTGKQTVAVVSEILESFGGAGYVEDTGLPMLLRDAQVLPIWEGTTNVLSLDALRAISREDAMAPLLEDLRARATRAKHPSLKAPAERVLATIQRIEEWFEAAQSMDLTIVEAGARRFALTLGRTAELALLVDEAQWAIDARRDGRAAAAARRLATHGVDLLVAPGHDEGDARSIAMDEALPA
ncbi:MAG: acyl-CoA dehydrogenase, partial [Myxococcales bacterium]|nr:acyl-CoA dehydrogenase [Myxococcales bacterium]